MGNPENASLVTKKLTQFVTGRKLGRIAKDNGWKNEVCGCFRETLIARGDN